MYLVVKQIKNVKHINDKDEDLVLSIVDVLMLMVLEERS